MFGLGLGPTYVRGAAGGAGGGTYHADAVHWNGDSDSELRIASLSCTDSALFSFSFWQKAPTITTEPEVWIVPSIFNEAFFPNEDRRIAIALANEGGANNLIVESTVQHGLGWNHFLFSADTSTADPLNKCKLYINDVDRTSVFQGGDFAFVPVFNGQVLQHPRKDTAYVADTADFWLAVGQSLLDGSGDIPEATRRKFISAAGKPVYLGANGELPTGTSPTVFFSGDATAYKTNRGPGGAFAFTGTLINASTSPSD